jgi:hypothetical protein
VKKRGRIPEGFFDERRANAAAPEAVEAWRIRDRRRRADRAPLVVDQAADRVTVRDLAHEWLANLRDVKGASPATVQDYGFLLREPGQMPRRGDTPAAGRLMRAFGDVRAVDVTPRDVSKWLTKLDRESLTTRNVNKHRQVLHSVSTYGTRADTYRLPANPVAETDRRRELPPEKLDNFEPHEVEALAVAAARGPHRIAPSYKGGRTTSETKRSRSGSSRTVRTGSSSGSCSTAACGSGRRGRSGGSACSWPTT